MTTAYLKRSLRLDIWRRAVELGGGRYEALLPPLLFALFVTAVSHWSIAYQLDLDEGLNLMKGALVAKGFGLYSEIWSDQPPVLTFLLADLERIFPANVTAARALVLVFSGLLLWSLFRILFRSEGRACAWLAMAALASLGAFQKLSVSVMIGLPAVALAVMALDQVLAGAFDNKRWRYCLAGVLFALSLQTKLFTATLIPTLVLATCLQAGKLAPWRMRAPNLALLSVSTIAVFVTIAAVTGEPIFSQLIVPHYRVSGSYDLSRLEGFSRLIIDLSSKIPAVVVILFTLGLIATLAATKVTRLIPIVWLISGFLILSLHQPSFPHHLVLLYPSIAWISSLSINLARVETRRLAIAVICVLLLVSIGVSRAFNRRAENEASARSDAWSFPAELRKASPDSWVVADILMDAYRAGRLVPPELAVWSGKRVMGGYLPADFLIAAIQKRRPETILLRRFQQPQRFVEYLESTYVEACSPALPGTRCYIRARSRQAEGPAEAEAVSALVTAMNALRMHSLNGGFAGHYDLATAKMWGRDTRLEPMQAGTILVRPPGATQQAGQCFLRGYRITGQQSFLDAATEAGKVLACAQGSLGGWDAVARLNRSCAGQAGGKLGGPDEVATLDDGASQSALQFLMDLATAYAARPDPVPSWLTSAIEKGMDFLLLAQHDGGGWPQHYPSRGNGYHGYDTLNDGATSESIATLLRASNMFGDSRYLAAAIRGGGFLIKAQGPPTQPAWAQQYDSSGRPARARAFEPAAYGSEETGFAMNALLDLYIATRDEQFIADLRSARAWLERSAIRPNIWARLYEVGTNRPIYADRDGATHYSLDEISPERGHGYRWEAAFPSVTRALDRHDALLNGGIEGLMRYGEDEKQRAEQHAYSEAVPLVPAIIAAARPTEGWVENGVLSTETFVANCKTVLDLVEFTPAKSSQSWPKAPTP